MHAAADAVRYVKHGKDDYHDLAEEEEEVEFDVGTASGLSVCRRRPAPAARSESTEAGDRTEVNGRPSTSYSSLPQPATYTVDQAVEQCGFGAFQWILSVVTGLSWMAEAMEMMILSLLSPALSCDWGISSWKQALITTIVFCGMMLGAGFWGTFSDKYGRKTVLIFQTAVTLYYGLLSAWSPNLVWMLLLRGMVGFGVSGGAQSVTLYSEFLPVAARAKSIVAIEVFFAGGIFIEVLLAYLIMPTIGWRWLLVISALPLFLFLLTCKWLPESARYDIVRGQKAKALATLERMARYNKKPLPPGELVASGKQVTRGSLRDLFTPEFRTTTLILWMLWFANTFCYYGIILMTTELVGLDDAEVCAASASGKVAEPSCPLDCRSLSNKDYGDLMWTTVAEFPGLVVTFFVIDVIGRRWTMLGEFFVFAVFVALVAVCAGRTVMIVFIFIARAMISGAFQVVFVYTPEVYPTHCRAIGLGSCSTFARIGAIITPFIAQVLLRYSLHATVALYAGVAIIAAVLSRLLPIETKGRQLEEVVFTH